MNTTISKKGESVKIKGEFYVTYSAERFGKIYTTVHLNPISNKSEISADELNESWKLKYNGLCPFNGDSNFQVLKIQKRTQF